MSGTDLFGTILIVFMLAAIAVSLIERSVKYSPKRKTRIKMITQRVDGMRIESWYIEYLRLVEYSPLCNEYDDMQEFFSSKQLAERFLVSKIRSMQSLNSNSQ